MFFSWCFPVEWGEVKGYPLPRTAERYSVSSILAAAFVENGAMTNLNRVNKEDVFRFVLSAVHHFHHRYQYGARLATRHLQSVNYFCFFGVCCQVVLACCYFLMYSYDILNWIADISYSVFNEGQQMMVMLVRFIYIYVYIQIYIYIYICLFFVCVCVFFFLPPGQQVRNNTDWAFQLILLILPGSFPSKLRVWPPLNPIGSSCFLANWHDSCRTLERSKSLRIVVSNSIYWKVDVFNQAVTLVTFNATNNFCVLLDTLAPSYVEFMSFINLKEPLPWFPSALHSPNFFP